MDVNRSQFILQTLGTKILDNGSLSRWCRFVTDETWRLQRDTLSQLGIDLVQLFVGDLFLFELDTEGRLKQDTMHCNSIQFNQTLPLQPSLLGISTSTLHQAGVHKGSVKGGPDQSPGHGGP